MSSRTEIADAFRAAKPLLAPHSGSELTSYICVALERAKHPAWPYAESTVMLRLGRHATVTSYVIHELGEVTATLRQVQEFRHRWLDSLIEEYSL